MKKEFNPLMSPSAKYDLDDLGIDPTEPVTLVLAWHLGCETMCEFTKQGWVTGWTKLR